MSCNMRAEGAHILTLAGRKLELKPAPRSYLHLITYRDDHLLRSELVTSKRGVGSSQDSSDVRLDLGDHPMAQELRDLNLGRVLAYQYSPQFQLIEMPVSESFHV